MSTDRTPPRTPPEVLSEPGAVQATFQRPQPQEVPTLTEVVAQPKPAVSIPAFPESFSMPGMGWTADGIRNHFDIPAATAPLPPLSPDSARMQRVLQRVDATLEAHLSSVITQVAESVAREWAQRLKTQLEPVIRQAVVQALDDENSN